ncbi:hypothetical protein J7337_007937 [Fusarium musae]|uniref:Uncharacterized protein n=1 Tax=Fusarium musae TaxID=1042133 RepID=A0A9P8DCT9_9HYPO|nr:hypothetical protein J7337_007937 [Fusarium musae]KAG9499481.1 hypothetical protein J7337_007937 [Fusarium musae]
MNDYSPRLHVIYAGRGDAMYIEWTDKTKKKHLVLLDGGPLVYEIAPNPSGPTLYKKPYQKRPGGNDAPYSKYLFAAGQHIWKTRISNNDKVKFEPSAIINSHPHDDHLDGLLAFLNYALAKRPYDFTFNGNFYQPFCDGSWGLKNTREQLVDELEWTEGKGFEYDGIQVDYPDPKSILKWYPKPKLGGGPNYNPDKSWINLESILMRTVPAKMEVEGTMYFTGDNVGWKITAQKPPTKLSIYKIQHHGSMVNTQIQDDRNIIHANVGKEAVVRDWFEAILYPKWNLKGKGPSKIIEILKKKHKKFGVEKRLKLYKGRLDNRYGKYTYWSQRWEDDKEMREIEGNLRPIPSTLYREVLAEVKKIPATDPAYAAFFLASGEKTKWWEKSTDWEAGRREFLRYMAVGQIRKFFSTFVADAYVISANYHHKHPSPETILGLALAINDQLKNKDKTKGGTLYVTDGSAVDLPGLEDLAEATGVDWKTLSTGLTIRVLKGRCYMSLDASDDFKGLDRDTTSATEEISFDRKKIAERIDFRADVEADTSHLGERDLGPIFCSIVPPDITQKVCLDISRDTPDLVPWSIVPPKNLLVEYAWITQGSTSPTGEDETRHLVVKQWMVTDNKWKTMDIWMEKITAVWGKSTKTLLYWKVAGTKKAFYIKTVSLVPTLVIEDHKSPLPPGYQLVYFVIELDPKNKILMPAIPRLPHGPPSFRSFCIASVLDPTTISTASKAIEALTSNEIVMALDLHNNFETAVLNYQIHLDKSVVEYDFDEVSVEVQSASIIFLIPDNATIQLGSETFLVKEVTFDLSWDKQDLIKAKLDVKTTTKTEVVVKREVPGAKHASTLRKSLIGMGVKPEELTKVQLPKLLGYLINSDSKIYSLLYQETPASLLLSGILRLVPDLEKSRARVTMLPGNMPLIHQVDIKCNLDTAVGVLEGESKPKPFDPHISFAGVNLVIQTLGLSVYNATSPGETIILTGTARFATAKKQGLIVNLRCVIEGQDREHPEVEFTIDGTQSLHDLVTELSGTMRFTEAVPLNGKGFTLQSLSPSQVGFAVTQPVTAHSHCVLSRVWASTDFDEWQNFLPSSVPKVKGDVKVQVYNPLDANHISVGVQVNYKARMKTTPPCDIDVTFSANPLPKSDSYEFRLWISPSNQSLFIYDFLEGVGITDTVTFDDINNVLPMHASPDTTFLIHQISLAVEKSTTSGWSFGDWSLRISVGNLRVLPDVLMVRDGTIDTEYLDGVYHASMQADFIIEKINTIARASFKLPQKDKVGSLSIEVPEGISVLDMIDALGLPNALNSLPVLVKSILEVQLMYARFTIGYPVASSKNAKILGCELGFNWDDGLEIGFIGLNSVKVDVFYTSSESPLGSGKTEYKFTIAAMFNKNAVMAHLSYDSAIEELSLNIEAFQTVLVTDILKTLLGDKITNALVPAIGTLAFRQGRLTIDTGPSNVVKYFKLELGETATVKVNNLTVTTLLIEYTAAVSKLPEPKPASLLLLGQVRNGTAAARISISCIAKGDEPAMVKASLEPISKTEPLTLTGLLTLFGFSKPTFIEPEGCPEFFSLNVIEMSATIEVRQATETERGTLIVRALDAVAVSTGTLSIFDTVTLQNIGLGVHYTKDKKDETVSITAKVIGDLIFQGFQGPIRVAYIQTKEGREFHGIYIKQDAAPPLSFEKMAGQFLSADKYAIPEHLGMPKIGLRQVEVHLVIKKSLQISGVGSMQWGYESNGVPIDLAEIGGEITVKKTNQGSLLLPEGTEYSAFITGKLTITDFASKTEIRARLRIGSSHDPVLTAVLQKTTNDNKELVRLSQNMSSNKQLAWDCVSPDGTADINFPSTNVYLYADLSRSKGKLFLCAHIDDLGDATIFARPDTNDPTRHSYFFSVSCTNLTKIWEKTKEPVMSTFKLSQIGAQIIGYHGTVGGLKDELVLIKTAAIAEDIKIEDSSSILTTMDKEKRLDPGGWFFATVQLQQPNPSPLVKALEGSMDLNQGGVITLFANIDKSDQTRTIYGMSVNNLYLLGGTMVVSGQGTYTPAAGANQPTIAVDAQMKLLSLTKDPFTITASLTVTPILTEFSLTGKTSGPLQKPFGTMFNAQIELATLKGVIRHTEPKSAVYTFKGSGSIGSSSLKFSSLIIFDQDLKPTVVALVLLTELPDPKLSAVKQRDLTTDDVFRDIIQPNSATSPSWPIGYSRLIFKAATVYYASKDFVDSDKMSYEQGYHVRALVGFFGYDFTVSATIPLDQSGLTVAATYEGTVDLSFAKFNNTTVSIITVKDESAAVYGAKADLTLFMKSGFHIDLKYQLGRELYSATGSYRGTDTILGLSNPTVTLTYDNKTGLMSINKWSTYQDLKDNLSTVAFAEGLKEASGREMTCEKIVQLIFKEIITTQYNMEFKGASVSDTHLLLNFSGTWDVKIVLEPPVTIAKIPLPEISIQVSKKLSLDQLGAAIVKMLVDNISSIALQLLQQPEKLATFFGALVVKEYMQQTITALICRRVDRPNVRERANQLVEENERDVRSNRQRIDEEVGRSSASSSIEVVGGSLATAEGLLDGLITLFGLMGSLVGVYSVMAPGKADELKKKAAEAKQQKEKAEAKVAELKERLVQGLSLDPQVPISTSFKDDETIMLDWSKVPLKFQADATPLSWDIIFSPRDDINNPDAIEMSTASASRTFTTPPTRVFLSAPSIWMWVRAKASFGKTVVQGLWHPAQTLTHMPSMIPPKEVRLDFPSVINGTHLTVSMPRVAPGDYRICIVAQDDLAASRPLYSTSVRIAATSDFAKQVRVLEVEACTPTTTGIRAVAKTLSSEPAEIRDSPYTSSQSIEILPPPLNLTASMACLTVMATWDLPGQSQDDCELVVLNAVTVEPETTATIGFQATKEGQRLASVQDPSFQEGYHIVLAARQKSTKISAIGLYTTLSFVVSNIPLWTIDAIESHYVVPSKSLVLHIESASRAAGPLTFELLLSGVTTVSPSSTTRRSDTSVVLDIDNLKEPYPSTVQVRATNAAQVRGIFGAAWNFPSVPRDLPAPQPKISYTAGIITLAWPAIPVAKVQVLVWVQDSKTMKVLCSKKTPPSATSLMFSSQDFLIVPGMDLIFTLNSRLDNIRGSTTMVSYEIADMNKGWGTPHELIIPAPETKVTYSAVTAYSVPQPMDSTLFWASNSAKKITKLDWNTGNWLASTITSPSIDGLGFCSITNTSRHTGHKECFYIREDGIIRGFLYFGSGGGWSPQTYAFATETANLNNGGVIDAVSPNSTTSLLCWVARDGSLRYSVWGSGTRAWSVANYAAEPQSATITEAGFIRATSQDGKGVHVFYRGRDGDLRGVFCNLVSDGGSMTWKGFTIHTDPDTRPRGSALCVSGVGTPIRIFWSSATGRVVEAHRDGEDLDSWKVQSVTGADSVGTSNMTAVYRDSATMCLWWITPGGAICRGDGNISTDGKISDWTVTKQLPDCTALSTTASPWPPGVTSNFYTTSHSSVMSIFWVSPDQVLMGQTWSRDH